MYNRAQSKDESKQEKIDNISKYVIDGKKKWVRYDEGAIRYSMGITSFRQLAKEAKAVYRVNRIVLVNTEKIDEYMPTFLKDMVINSFRSKNIQGREILS